MVPRHGWHSLLGQDVSVASVYTIPITRMRMTCYKKESIYQSKQLLVNKKIFDWSVIQTWQTQNRSLCDSFVYVRMNEGACVTHWTTEQKKRRTTVSRTVHSEPDRLTDPMISPLVIFWSSQVQTDLHWSFGPSGAMQISAFGWTIAFSGRCVFLASDQWKCHRFPVGKTEKMLPTGTSSASWIALSTRSLRYW